MNKWQKVAVGVATLCVGAGALAQQSKSGLGVHTRATNDPVFIAQEYLGRPTNSSITINAASRQKLEVYYEYGTKPGVYTGKTATATAAAGEPFNILLDKLQPNTRYYYRMQYRQPGAAAFTARAEHTFMTQRPAGSTFTFTAQFDPHLDDNIDDEAYKLSMKNMAADQPDFLIDVGDNFFVEKLHPVTNAGVEERVQLMRSYYDMVSHSTSLFLAIGNHEGEWGRHLDGTANNVAVLDTLQRKRYIPNPVPDAFYTGSSKEWPLVGVRQANYAWTWGDALFIVLDPYWNQPVAPELSGDWSLTLGREQYEWLKKTLETSNAKYKFVFSHNLIGGLNMNGPMRGGVAAAKYLEWGGYNLDDTWGFDKARPGWAMPIHQLLVKNKVNIFFHGHDHMYAKEDLDGIVYQEGPQPGAMNATPGNNKSNRYKYTGAVGGTGYLRVRVSPEEAKVDFVQTWVPAKETAALKNGMVGASYTVKPK